MLGKPKKIATQGSQAFMNFNAVKGLSNLSTCHIGAADYTTATMYTDVANVVKGAALFSPALGVAAPMVDVMNLAGT